MQGEANRSAVSRLSNLRTINDIIKLAAFQRADSEIKVTENLGSTTFNNTEVISKWLNI
jgi:hypothetical protein